MLPPKAHNEAERLAALRRYQILDTPAEAAFDDITRLIASICEAPIAVINFIDEDRQWFKSEVGLGVRETPLDTTICGHAILNPGLTLIPDLAEDERFACNPLVSSGPRWRFYAGAPLQTDDGYVLGTLCVLDMAPRQLTARQKDALVILAKQVVAQLELRRQWSQAETTAAELRGAQEDVRQRDEQLQLIVNMVPALMSYIDAGGRYRLNNHSYQTWFGKPSGDFVGKTVPETLGGEAWELLQPHFEAALAGRQVKYEHEVPYQQGPRWCQGTYTPHFDVDGKVLGIVAMVNDVTERKHAEQALHGAKAELESQVADLTCLRGLGLRLAGPMEFDVMCRELVQAIATLQGTDKGSLYLADGDGIRLACSVGVSAEYARQVEYLPAGAGACGTAFQRGRRVLVQDTETDPLMEGYRDATRKASYRAAHCTPLITGEGKVLGVLTSFFDEPHLPPERQLRVVDLYARQAVDFMEAARLRETLALQLTERRRAEQVLLEQKGLLEMIATGRPLDDCLASLTDAVSRLHPRTRACILLADAPRRSFARAFAAQFDASFGRGIEGALIKEFGGGTCAEAVYHGRPVTCTDIANDSHWSKKWRDLCVSHRVLACHSAPIFGAGGLPLGSLMLCFDEARPPSEWERQLAEFGVQVASIALERDRSIQALRESEAHARLALDVARLGTWSWDAARDVVLADARCREICGLAAEATLSTAVILARIHPDDRPRIEAALDAAPPPQGDRRYAEEFRFVHDDGSARWVVSRGQASFDGRAESKRAVMLHGTVLDITERRQAAEALIDADRRKDQFLATLAHELRNPLAPISNALALWPAVQNDAAKMDKLHGMMTRQVRQITRLIDDLLDVSRITRGKISLRRSRADIGTVINGAVEAIRPFIERQRHELNIVLPEAPLAMEADIARLPAAFGNILNNAAKYTPAGGVIWIGAEQDGGQVVVRVRDNGPGIPADMLDKIFGMFVQVDGTLERSHGGLGIGLTLVKTLIEMHGGSIEARSDGMGRGAEFIVRLPVLPGQVAPASVNGLDYGLRKLVPVVPRRVLVVDDIEASATTLSMVLQSIGHDVRTANDGPAGIAAAREYRPEAVFLDIAMPGMNGYEVARRLRADPALTGIKLIALTGFGQEEDLRRASEAGFDHHLVKPAAVEAIQALLAGVHPPPPRAAPCEYDLPPIAGR